MNNHPLNLTLRFVLELAALAVVTLWTYRHFGQGIRLIMAIVAPLAVSVTWAVFRVESDPGPAPVAIPGWSRLFLEALLFGLCLWMLHQMGYRLLFILIMALLLTHYLISYDRVSKLLQ